MSKIGVPLRNRILRYLGKFTRLLLATGIYALVIWYGVVTTAHLDAPPTLTWIAIALVAFGIAGSTYRILIDVAKEAKGGIVVLAEFLNNNLLEPQKRRLREQGRALGVAEGIAEGRAEVLAEIRARLLQEGIDPDRIIPLEKKDGADRS